MGTDMDGCDVNRVKVVKGSESENESEANKEKDPDDRKDPEGPVGFIFLYSNNV